MGECAGIGSQCSECCCPPAASVAASAACSSGSVCSSNGPGSGSGLWNACAELHGSCWLRTSSGCESGVGAARPTNALSSACACCTSPCSAVLWPFMASNSSLKLLSCSCVSRAVISAAAQAIIALMPLSAAQAAPGGRGLDRRSHCRLYAVSDRGGSRWRSMGRMQAGLLWQSRDVVNACSKRSAGALSCACGRGSVRAVTSNFERFCPKALNRSADRAPASQCVTEVPPDIILRFSLLFCRSLPTPVCHPTLQADGMNEACRLSEQQRRWWGAGNAQEQLFALLPHHRRPGRAAVV